MTDNDACPLARIELGLYATSEDAMTDLVAAYVGAGIQIKSMNDYKNALKEAMSEILVETGGEKMRTPAGSVALTKPTVSARYDTKTLDVLCADDEELAARIGPFRKETMRAGSLRVTT